MELNDAATLIVLIFFCENVNFRNFYDQQFEQNVAFVNFMGRNNQLPLPVFE